jgi:hypothetical protein
MRAAHRPFEEDFVCRPNVLPIAPGRRFSGLAATPPSRQEKTPPDFWGCRVLKVRKVAPPKFRWRDLGGVAAWRRDRKNVQWIHLVVNTIKHAGLIVSFSWG